MFSFYSSLIDNHYVQVVKENQILHKGSQIIDQETATLADMNIFPGDKLWVKDSEIHEDRDIAGNFSFSFSKNRLS